MSLPSIMGWLIVLAAFVIGLAIGGAVRSKEKEQKFIEFQKSRSSSASRTSQMKNEKPLRQLSPVVAGRFAKIASEGGILSRSEALREELERLPLTEFHHLLFEMDDWMRIHLELGDPDAPSIFYTSYETVAEVMAEKNPDQAMTYLLSRLSLPDRPDIRNPDEIGYLIGAVFRRWVNQSPESALGFIVANGQDMLSVDEGLVSRLSHDLAKSWIKKDSNSALAWINRQQVAFRNSLLAESLGALMQVDTTAALKIFEENQNLSESARLASGLAEVWSADDPQGAFEWVQMQSPTVVEESLPLVLGEWLNSDTKVALKAFDELTGAVRDRALPVLAQHYWSSRDGYTMAAKALENEPDGSGRQEAVTDLMVNWGKNDPESAAVWLQKELPTGENLDRAIDAFVTELAEVDPEAGIIWSSVLENPELRMEAMSRQAEQWFQRSPRDTVRWIEKSERLSDKERVELSQLFPNFFQ